MVSYNFIIIKDNKCYLGCWSDKAQHLPQDWVAMQYFRKVNKSFTTLASEARVTFFKHLLLCINSAAKRLTS